MFGGPLCESGHGQGARSTVLEPSDRTSGKINGGRSREVETYGNATKVRCHACPPRGWSLSPRHDTKVELCEQLLRILWHHRGSRFRGNVAFLRRMSFEGYGDSA